MSDEFRTGGPVSRPGRVRLLPGERILTRDEMHALRDDLTAARAEVERLRAALSSILIRAGWRAGRGEELNTDVRYMAGVADEALAAPDAEVPS